MTVEKFLLASIAAFAMAACAPKEAAEEAPAAEQPSAEPVVVEPSTEEPAAETPAVEEPAADACGAADHQSLIGSNVAAITLSGRPPSSHLQAWRSGHHGLPPRPPQHRDR